MRNLETEEILCRELMLIHDQKKKRIRRLQKKVNREIFNFKAYITLIFQAIQTSITQKLSNHRRLSLEVKFAIVTRFKIFFNIPNRKSPVEIFGQKFLELILEFFFDIEGIMCRVFLKSYNVMSLIFLEMPNYIICSVNSQCSKTVLVIVVDDG